MAQELQIEVDAPVLEGEYIFFEINQNGEWAWIELRTGMPIGKAIANILITPNGQ